MQPTNDSCFEFNRKKKCAFNVHVLYVRSLSNISVTVLLSAHFNGHQRVDYNLYDRFRFISLSHRPHARSHIIYAKWKLYRRSTISMSKSQKMETKGIIYTAFCCSIISFQFSVLFFFSSFFNFLSQMMRTTSIWALNIQREKGKTMQFIKIYYQKKHATIWIAAGYSTERIPEHTVYHCAFAVILRLLLRLCNGMTVLYLCQYPLAVHVNLLK